MLTRARHVALKPYNSGVKVVFSIGQITGSKRKDITDLCYNVTRATYKYLKCLKFPVKSFEVSYDIGLSEGHDLATKPGDIDPIALRDLLAICDISKTEDAMTLISSLASQNPKDF